MEVAVIVSLKYVHDAQKNVPDLAKSLYCPMSSLTCIDRTNFKNGDIVMRIRPIVIGAAFALVLPWNAWADEALEGAQREMREALGSVPPFIALLPEGAQAGAWAFMKGSSGNPDGEIPPKYRELIALGVAAQIPCTYCAYAHTVLAKANGATEAEVQEAIAYAGEVRLWSTILNGNQFDLGKFQAEIDGILAHAAKAQKSN